MIRARHLVEVIDNAVKLTVFVDGTLSANAVYDIIPIGEASISLTITAPPYYLDGSLSHVVTASSDEGPAVSVSFGCGFLVFHAQISSIPTQQSAILESPPSSLSYFSCPSDSNSLDLSALELKIFPETEEPLEFDCDRAAFDAADLDGLVGAALSCSPAEFVALGAAAAHFPPSVVAALRSVLRPTLLPPWLSRRGGLRSVLQGIPDGTTRAGLSARTVLDAAAAGASECYRNTLQTRLSEGTVLSDGSSDVCCSVGVLVSFYLAACVAYESRCSAGGADALTAGVTLDELFVFAFPRGNALALSAKAMCVLFVRRILHFGVFRSAPLALASLRDVCQAFYLKESEATPSESGACASTLGDDRMSGADGLDVEKLSVAGKQPGFVVTEASDGCRSTSHNNTNNSDGCDGCASDTLEGTAAARAAGRGARCGSPPHIALCCALVAAYRAIAAASEEGEIVAERATYVLPLLCGLVREIITSPPAVLHALAVAVEVQVDRWSCALEEFEEAVHLPLVEVALLARVLQEEHEEVSASDTSRVVQMDRGELLYVS